MRTVYCVLFAFLAAPHDLSAVVVVHEFSGVVYDSTASGVAVNDSFSGVLTYDTNQPDLLPADPSNGGYGEFKLSVEVGPVSVSQTNPVHYGLWFTDQEPGSSDRIGWLFGIGPGDVALTGYDPTGTAFDSDALPLQLSISSFEILEIDSIVSRYEHFRGRILSISSRIIPEPTSLALLSLGSLCLLRRR